MLETKIMVTARPAGLNAAVRVLLARLSHGVTPRPGWAGPEAGASRSVDADPRFEQRLRADAHAAFASVEGSPGAALDAALAVVEGEVARLRTAVLAYGEALKAIQIYGTDADARTTAAAALRRAPVPLRAAPPVPRFAGDARGCAHG
jgi:hypothetical protein